MSIVQPFANPDHRSLFDEAFLDSGCNPTIFEKGGVEMTRVDDTVGSWATNYAVFVVGLVGTFKFTFMMKPIAQRHVWTSGYFLLTGLGYGMAGVNHQIRELKTDPNFYYITFIVATLGSLSLQYQIAVHIIRDKIRQMYTMFVSLIALAIIMALIVWREKVYADSYLFASNLWFLLFYSIQRDWTVCTGSLFAMVGFAVQFILSDACGPDAYDDCFQDCPLANPRVFNHNATFHTLVAIGLLIHLFAKFAPSESTAQSRNSNQQEDDKAPGGNNQDQENPVEPVESFDKEVQPVESLEET